VRAADIAGKIRDDRRGCEESARQRVVDVYENHKQERPLQFARNERADAHSDQTVGDATSEERAEGRKRRVHGNGRKEHRERDARSEYRRADDGHEPGCEERRAGEPTEYQPFVAAAGADDLKQADDSGEKGGGEQRASEPSNRSEIGPGPSDDTSIENDSIASP
jgi:hypothetical protein